MMAAAAVAVATAAVTIGLFTPFSFSITHTTHTYTPACPQGGHTRLLHSDRMIKPRRPQALNFTAAILLVFVLVLFPFQKSLGDLGARQHWGDE